MMTQSSIETDEDAEIQNNKIESMKIFSLFHDEIVVQAELQQEA